MVTREVYRTIAAAEVSDDYGVTLRTRKRKTHMTVEEAAALAGEIVEALAAAEKARADDLAAWAEMGTRAEPAGFDVDLPRDGS